GTADRSASTTAGWRFAAAVPLVHSSTAGIPDRPSPRATNAADRSSWTTCNATSARSARAKPIGVVRLPGATPACRTPRSAPPSTRVAQKVACTVCSLTTDDDTGRSVEGVIVEVWSDVVCPWCYIGKRRFETAAARLADDPEFDEQVEVVYRPFQLDPNAPP